MKPKNKYGLYFVIGALILVISSQLMLSDIQTPIRPKETKSDDNYNENPLNVKETVSLKVNNYKTHGLIENLSITVNVSRSVSSESTYPSIAVNSSDIIHIVWQERDGSDDDIYYCTYNTVLDSISTNFDVSSSSSNYNTYPDIYVDSNNYVHISWTDQESKSIKYRRRTPYGSWGTIENVFTDSYNIPARPDIAVDQNGRKMIVWENSSTPKQLCYSIYSGASWSVPLTFGDITSKNEPKIVCGQNNVFHIVYWNGTLAGPLNDIVYVNYSTSLSAKKTLTSSLRLSSLSYAARYPDIATWGNKVFVCWSDQHTGAADKFQLFLNNKTMSGDFNINYVNQLTTDVSYNNNRPSIAFDSEGNVTVTWGKYLSVSPNTGDHYVQKIGGTLQQLSDPSTNTTTPSTRTSIAIDSYDSVFCAWRGRISGIGEVYLRELDRFGPQLNVQTPPNNGTSIMGLYDLTCQVESTDFKKLIWTYWNDTNENGVADGGDGSFWKIIYQTTSFSMTNYTWDTSNLNVLSSILRANATDENGLCDLIYIGDVSIDNLDPQISKIIDFTDNIPHNSSEGDKRFTGNITIRFNARDNNSGVDRVELHYNATPSAILDTNHTINEIEINSTIIADGTYDFFLRTYDRSGNYNDSSPLEKITIDNTKPTPIILTANGIKVTNGTLIQIDLSSHPDVYQVKYFYYNASQPPSTQVLLKSDTNSGDGWNYILQIPEKFTTIVLIVNVTDQTGLYDWDTVTLRVDNVKPTPRLETKLTTIGFSAILNVSLSKDYTDNDTVSASVYYKEKDAFDVTYKKAGEITDVQQYRQNHPTYVNSTHIFLLIECAFYDIQTAWLAVDLQIRAVDNVGLIGVYNVTNIPTMQEPPEEIKEINSEVEKYTITLTWDAVSDATDYILFRSFTSFDSDEFNSLNVSARINYLLNQLGYSVGEKYCIARLDKDTTSYADVLKGPNTFYYLIIALKSGNPSKATGIDVEIEAENPDREIQPNQTSLWIYYFFIFVGGVAVLSSFQVKRMKVKYHKSRVTAEVKKITEKETATFEKKELELDARVPIEESAITKVSKPKQSLYSPVVSEIAKEAVKEEKVIDKCPTCGWILSSTATKCPRCGWKKV